VEFPPTIPEFSQRDTRAPRSREAAPNRYLQAAAQSINSVPRRAADQLSPAPAARVFDDLTARIRAARPAQAAAREALHEARRLDHWLGSRPAHIDLLSGEVSEVPLPAVVPCPDGVREAQGSRRHAYALRTRAARLMSHERVCCCGSVPQGEVSVVRAPHGAAGYSGLQTCGSVWMCPICARTITEARRRDLQHMAEFVRGGGGEVLMLTLTVPHGRGDDLRDLRTRLMSAYNRLTSGRYRLSALVPSYLGAVRSLEVTHGQHGWHPHVHVAIAVGELLKLATCEALEKELFERWSEVTALEGFSELSRQGAVQLQRGTVAGLDVAADPLVSYLAKWGIAEELTKLHTKQGRAAASRTPWGLLHDSAEGDHRAGELWREFARAFKGARQLFWSPGFRALCGLAPDLTDEVLAAAEPAGAELLGTLTRPEWLALRKHGDRVHLLEIVEFAGWEFARGYVAACLQQSGGAAVGRDEWYRRDVWWWLDNLEAQ
jgi:Replication protein